MISHSWGIFCVVVAQDPVATELQQLLCEKPIPELAELAKQTAAQLRQLAGTTGVQQREAPKRSC